MYKTLIICKHIFFLLHFMKISKSYTTIILNILKANKKTWQMNYQKQYPIYFAKFQYVTALENHEQDLFVKYIKMKRLPLLDVHKLFMHVCRFFEQYYKAQYKPQYTNHNIAQSIICLNRNGKSRQNNHSYVINQLRYMRFK